MATKKTQPRAEACVRTDADALIAAAQTRSLTSTPFPDAATLAELRKIVEYNDAAARNTRVTQKQAIALLRSRGWLGGSEQALNSLCVAALGRRSYVRA